MLFFYLKELNLVELIFQVMLLYNMSQLLKQMNFYYLISYFFMTMIYLGMFLMMYDLDLNCMMMWMMYGGICMVFFTYSLIWFEIFKNFYKNMNLQKKNFFNMFLFITIFFSYKYNNIDFFLKNDLYMNLYLNNELNKMQELEMLGWGMLYYTTFLFIFFSYFLLMNCIVITMLNNNSKKIKNNLLNHYYLYFFKNKNLYYLSFMKNQHFFIQEYENNIQKYSIIKNYKMTNYFHQMKNMKSSI